MLEKILDVILNDDGYDGVISIEPHVASIVHLKDVAAEPSSKEKFDSYVRYGKMFVDMLEKLKK
jgi:predicted xylose isomerase-like sugar epimerase